MWVLAHLDDLASDWSAIHHIHDIAGLEARTFMELSMRLPAYPGVMTGRVLAQERVVAPRTPAPVARPVAPPATPEVLAQVSGRLRSMGLQGIGYTKVAGDD